MNVPFLLTIPHTKPDGKMFGPGHSYIVTTSKSSTQSMSPYIRAPAVADFEQNLLKSPTKV